MKKIASPQELRSELRRLVAYCGEGTPSRNKLATELQSLANAVEASTTKQGAHNKAKVGDMIQSLHFHRPLDGSVIGTVTRVEVDDKDGVEYVYFRAIVDIGHDGLAERVEHEMRAPQNGTPTLRGETSGIYIL